MRYLYIDLNNTYWEMLFAWSLYCFVAPQSDYKRQDVETWADLSKRYIEDKKLSNFGVLRDETDQDGHDFAVRDLNRSILTSNRHCN